MDSRWNNRLIILTVACFCVLSSLAFAQFPQAKLLPSDARSNIYFGNAVALGEGFLAVGCRLGSSGDVWFNENGKVFIYTGSGTSWTQSQILTPTDTWSSIGFGSSIKIDGTTIYIGCSNRQAIYVFEKTGATWTQVQKITPSVSTPTFGGDFAVKNGILAVGAYSGGNGNGAVIIYNRNGGVWTQEAILTPGGTGLEYWDFGGSVVIEDQTLVVTAPSQDATPNGGEGAVYFYEKVGGVWSPISIYCTTEFYNLGTELTVSDGRIFATANGGFLAAFEKHNGTWGYSGKQAVNTTYGRRIALSDNHLAVSSPWDHSKAQYAGVVYLWDYINGAWTNIDREYAADALANDCLGYAIDLNQNYLLVGDDHKVGGPAAYIFDLRSPIAGRIIRQNPSVDTINAAAVIFRAYFTKPVSNITAGCFSLSSTGGQTAASIDSLTSSSGQVVDIIVNTVNLTTGTIRLDLSSIGAIQDTDGHALVSTRTGDESYTVDRLVPTGSVQINSDAAETNLADVTLSMTANGTGTNITQMRFSNNGIDWSDWQAYSATKAWRISSGLGAKTVYAAIQDKAGNEAIFTDDILLNNQPPTVDLNGPGAGGDFTALFTESAGAISAVAPDSTIVEPDTGQLISLTATIRNLKDSTNESLSVDTTLTPLITASYNASTGRLTITGTDSTADYEQVLRSLKYNNIKANPDEATREIEIVACDGSYSDPVVSSIQMITFNDPTIIDANGSTIGTEWAVSLASDNTAPTVDSDATLIDVDDAIIPWVHVTLTNRPDGAQESLSANATGTSVTATYDAPTGVLTLAGPDTTGNFLQVLKSIRYSNSASSPNKEPRLIELQPFDGQDPSPIARTTIHFPFTSSNYFVDASRPDDTGDGFTWATAKKTIQAGIDAASADSLRREVWVKAGIYRDIVNMKSEVKVQGGYNGNQAQRDIPEYETIIDGELSRVKLVSLYSTVNTSLDGITVRNACSYGANQLGGGIYCQGANATNIISNCTIRGCELRGYSNRGAGIVIYDSSLIMRNCLIQGNYVAIAAYSGMGDGAGVCILGTSSPIIEGCRILDNYAGGNGGGMIITSKGFPVIRNNWICNNEAANYGAGFYVSGPSLSTDAPTFTGCTISGNWTANFGGGGCVYASYTRLSNCVFSGNAASGGGGGLGMISHFEQPVIANCTFDANFSPGVYGSALAQTAFTGGGGPDDFNLPIVDCIFANNTGAPAVAEYAGTADAYLRNCLFYNNPSGAFYDYYGSHNGRIYLDTQLATLHAEVPEAAGNINGDPALRTLAANAITGVWRSVDASNAGYLILTDPGAFHGQDLRGRIANPNSDGQPRDGYIIANTDDAIWLIGKADDYYQVEEGRHYVIKDFRIGQNSPCIDTGINTNTAGYGSVVSDIEGKTRGLDGLGDGPTGAPTFGDGSDYDIGAYEYTLFLDPAIDLNGPASGINNLVSLSPPQDILNIATGNATITDADSNDIQWMKVRIANPNPDYEMLTADMSGTTLSASYDSTAGLLTISGAADKATYETVLGSIVYSNTTPGVANAYRFISAIVSDGTHVSTPARCIVSMGDVAPPTVQSVEVLSTSTIRVKFGEAVLAGSETAANYTLSGSGKGTFAANPTRVIKESGNSFLLIWDTGEMCNAGDIAIAVDQVRDLVGNMIATPNQTSHLSGGNGIPPSLMPPADTGDYTTSTVRFTWATPTDAGSGLNTLRLQVGTSPGALNIFNGYVSGTTKTLTSANGISHGQTLYARLIATDMAGNSTTTGSSDGVTVDTVSPTASSPTTSGQYSNSTDVEFQWSAPSDIGSGIGTVRLIIGNSPGAKNVFDSIVSGNSQVVSALNGVAHGMTLYASLIVCDLAGNKVTTPSSNPILIDLEAPAAPTPSDDGDYTSGTVRFSWPLPVDAVSGVSDVTLRVGSSPGGNDIFQEKLASGQTFATLGAQEGIRDGLNLYASLVVTDYAGNSSVSSSSNGILVDMVSPTAPTPSASIEYTSQTEVSFAWPPASDSGSGIGSVRLQIGSTAGANDICDTITAANSMTLTEADGLCDGYELYARLIAADNAGNVSIGMSSNRVLIDQQPPSCTITEPVEPVSRCVAMIPISWDIVDPGQMNSGVRTIALYWSKDDGEFQAVNGASLLPGVGNTTIDAKNCGGDGIYRFRIDVVDRAGNKISTVSEKVTVKTANRPPSAADSNWVLY